MGQTKVKTDVRFSVFTRSGPIGDLEVEVEDGRNDDENLRLRI